MHIHELTEREPLTSELLALWERSVRAAHHFLSDAEITAIKEYVPQALLGVPHLIVAQDDQGKALGFIGIAEKHLEMLFLEPSARGQGLGRALMQYGIEHYNVTTTTVNEQNPEACGFYDHMGFKVESRNELDEQGQPYPVLHLRRA